MRFKSIRVRMTLHFVLTISFLMLAACGGLIGYAQWAAERKADALLAIAMIKIRHDLPEGIRHVDASDLKKDAERNKMALWVRDSVGQTLFQSQRGALPLRSDANWYVLTTKLPSKTVVLGLSWRETQQALRHQAAFLILLGLFVTAASTIGAWLVVGRTLSPIGDLSRQAQEASAENLLVRLEASSQDAEIVDLVSTLNELLARISEIVAAKGRFHASASHELRTPLQVLSGQLELALNRPRSNEEYHQFIEVASVYAQRLVALARDLLLLHQLDAARPPVKTEVNPTDICERALDWLTAKIQERGLQVQTELCRGVFLEAAPSHVEMLIRNLLENAVNYATPEGCVTIRMNLCGQRQVQFTIENDCLNQPDSDPQKWLEPFSRRDAAPHAYTSGTGLGLAICKAIADVNSWALKINSDAKKVTVSVRFASCRQEEYIEEYGAPRELCASEI